MNIWSGKLLSEAKFGHVIIIGGIVKPHPIKLSIDFAETDNNNFSSYSITDNIILHLNVRFNEKQIIRSSHFPSVGWSDEQISDNLIGKTLKNPIKPGKPFQIRLTILQAIFQVHINDELYCTYDYNHRPVHEIKFVRVKYYFERITQFDHRLLFPQLFPIQFDYDSEQLPKSLPLPSSSSLPSGSNDIATVINSGDHNKLSSVYSNQQLEYIFSSDVPAPIGIGANVCISGVISGDWNSQFAIDVLSNNSKLIIMRFNVRFCDKLIIRNSQRLIDGKFHEEDEEKIGTFPFKRGQTFKIGIIIMRDAFHFFINGHFYTYFNHRINGGITGAQSNLAIIKCMATQTTNLTITGIEYNETPQNLNKLTKIDCCRFSGTVCE